MNMSMSKITMLQTKIWLYIAVFGSTIIVALWLLQVVFFGSAYENRERYAIENLGQQIMLEYQYVSINSPFYSRFNRENIVVRLFNRSGLARAAIDPALADPTPVDLELYIEQYEQFAQTQTGPLIERIETSKGSASGLFLYINKLVNERNPELSYYACLISSVSAVSGTQEILRQQLFLVVIFFVLLSILVSYFISSAIARPMLELTESAKQLALGNYDVKFKGEDYTEINELANVLNYATDELAKTDQLKSQIMANVSHDLRTPLTMIKAYAEMIRDLSGDHPQKRTEHINVILEEADWMSALITDILEYSKIRSGNVHYEMQPFDLVNLTQESVLHFKDLALKSGVHLELTGPEEAHVVADLKMINRVLNNLISNALNHAGDQPKITITISAEENDPSTPRSAPVPPSDDTPTERSWDEYEDYGLDMDEAKKWTVRWQVRDYGSGISPEKLAQIWNAYFSSGETNKRLLSGTGLGLSIVQGILNDHGALFGVDSQLGEGTTFWFEL